MSRFKPKDPAWNFYDVVEEGSKKIVSVVIVYFVARKKLTGKVVAKN